MVSKPKCLKCTSGRKHHMPICDKRESWASLLFQTKEGLVIEDITISFKFRHGHMYQPVQYWQYTGCCLPILHVYNVGISFMPHKNLRWNHSAKTRDLPATSSVSFLFRSCVFSLSKHADDYWMNVSTSIRVLDKWTEPRFLVINSSCLYWMLSCSSNGAKQIRTNIVYFL